MDREFPQLYALASTGKVKTWAVSVHEADGGAIIRKRHGYIDGKIQSNDKLISVGKNIGKANETSPWEQAVSEAQSSWTRQVDRKYITEIPTEDNQSDIILPMLAQDFHKRKHNITYPCYAQPKMNGVRCLAHRVSEEEMIYLTRGGKRWETLDHLTPSIVTFLRVGEILDGEIYHPDWTFQEIVRNVKKLRDTSRELQFWIYDLADQEKTFTQRLEWLNENIPVPDPNLVLVPTEEIQSEDDVKTIHDKFIIEGNFEGAIVRNANGLYRFDHRSADLQKYKEFVDEEFFIVGGVSGTGLEEGCVVFECLTKDDKVFRVRPRGTREIRREWLDDIERLVGKPLTVRYKELSEDGIPIPSPVGIAIRDYE